MPITMIELFAGIGGGSAAAEQVVDPATKHPLFTPILAAEIDLDARKFFKVNFPGTLLEGDITKIEAIPLDADLLVAGPPCQSFSAAGKKEGFTGKSGTGFEIFINFIKTAKPKIILFENVNDISLPKFFPIIKKEFNAAGYIIKLTQLDSLDFGMPQHRLRSYIVAVKQDLPLSLKLETFPFPEFKYSKKERIEKSICPLFFALEENVTDQPKEYDRNKLAHNIIRKHLEVLVKAEDNGDDDNDVLSVTKGIALVRNIKNEVGAPLYSRFYGARSGKLVVGASKEKDTVPDKISDIKSTTLQFTELTGPAPTLTQKSPMIAMLGRKMTARELANIQGFPFTYKIPKSTAITVTKLFGNSYSVPVIRTLLARIATHFFDAPALELRKEKSLLKFKKTAYTDKDMLRLRHAVLKDDRGYEPKTSPLDELCEQYSDSFVVSRPLLNVRTKRKGSAFETVSATEEFLRKKARGEPEPVIAPVALLVPPPAAPDAVPVPEAPIARLESPSAAPVAVAIAPSFPLVPVARRASSLFVPAAASPAAPWTAPSPQVKLYSLANLGLSVFLAPPVEKKDALGTIYVEEELDRGWAP